MIISHCSFLSFVLHSEQLEEKQAESQDLTNQYKHADNDYNQKKDILKKLLKEAESVAPKNEWHERLDQEDLPENLGKCISDLFPVFSHGS